MKNAAPLTAPVKLRIMIASRTVIGWPINHAAIHISVVRNIRDASLMNVDVTTRPGRS